MDRTSINAKQYRFNPRKISKKQIEELKQSLEELGDLSGIIYNKTSGELVGGNQRSSIIDLNACEIQIVERNKKADKQGTLAVGFVIWKGNKYNYREVDWDESTEKKANILANKLGGDWDMKVLEEHFSPQDLLEWGWKKSELKWINKLDAFGSEEEFQPTLAKKVVTKMGDLYTLNDHRLQCGDSTDPDQVAKLLNGRTAKLQLTDPPYNVNYQARRIKPKAYQTVGIRNDNMSDENFAQFLFDFYSAYATWMAPGAVWYVFHADSKGHIFRNEFIRSGQYLAQVLQWVKDQIVVGRSDYQWQHEPILYGHTPDQELEQEIIRILEEQLGTRLEHYQLQHSPILYGWKKGGPHNWTSDRSQSTVLKFNRPTNSELHPTMKPVPLLEYLITNSTNENDLVVDAFGGSGSTMMASENMDRVCYTMELEANNCDTIVRRWVNLMTKQQKGIKVTKNGKDITQQKWLYGKATSKAK